MYSAAGYGTGLIPPQDWPFHTWLALYHTGDNEGPPKPAEVEKIFEEASQKLPGVKVRIGRLSDFAGCILKEKAEIPVVRGDMPDSWIHGPFSDPIGGGMARRVRPNIGTAEALGALLKIWGIQKEDPTQPVWKAYEQSLLYGEHTWGGSLHWVTEYGDKINWGYGAVWKSDLATGRFKRLEEIKIPANLDYDRVSGLSREVEEKLTKIKPQSLGQAGRISGVTPVAVTILMMHLKRMGAV
jgi:hypothetical protein